MRINIFDIHFDTSDVLIVAKTVMSNNKVCIGGFSYEKKCYVRLLNENGYPMDNKVGLNIGEIYTISYRQRQHIELPHSEDILVKKFQLKGCLERSKFLQFVENLSINIPHIRNLFNNRLLWDNNHGYLLFGDNPVCNYSVIIAKLSHDLYRSKINEDYFYYRDFNLSSAFEIKYVGESDINGIRVIKSGTPIRFSLARWWDGNGRYNPKRSYLQLSGFYK